MAERGIEHPALAIALLPDHRHHDTIDPGRVLAGEGRGRQHLVGGIDMHVILLGPVLEALQARHDRIIRLGHVDLVVDDVAGMRHPLAAAEKLIVHRIAERIAHAAVMAGEPDAAPHRRTEIERFRLLDLRHGVDRHDQRQVMDRRIGKRRRRGLDPDLEAFLLQPAPHHRGAEIGIMSRPTAPYNHRLAHCRHPFSQSVRFRVPPASSPAARRGFRSSRAGLRRRRSGTPPSPRAHGRRARRWRDAAGC